MPVAKVATDFVLPNDIYQLLLFFEICSTSKSPLMQKGIVF